MAWVKDGTKYKFYKNGEQFAVQDAPENFYTEKKSSYWIGKIDNFFSGQIAEVRIWKTARTAEDIKNNMYLPLTAKEIGLVGYWRLGGISEGKVIDFSVNGNDGIVYGDPYVSAATLNRKLAGGIDAVKYSNPELFAVSERATYEESFEFKVNSSTAVNLAYLDNADGKSNKIFTLAYWGKTSRSAEEKKPISAVQNKFEDLGNGWYRASCNVTIPDEVSLLRSFEIANVQGNWVSLEIRKHRIRLLSDSITEAKYADGVTLKTLADSQTTLATKLNQLELKEQQEGVLLKEKRELEAKIAAYNAQAGTRTQIERLKAQIATLTIEESSFLSQYNVERESPFNYYCRIRGQGSSKLLDVLAHATHDGAILCIHHDTNTDNQIWEFVPADGGFFKIRGKESGKVIDVIGYSTQNSALIHMYRDNNTDNQIWYFIPTSGGFFKIQGKQSGKLLDVVNYDTRDGARLNIYPDNNTSNQIWNLEKTSVQINNKISDALTNLQNKQQELSEKRKELANLEKVLTATPADKAAWDARLAQLIREITAIQTEINTLNTDFINGVKNTQQTPQTMPQVAKDGKGLVTQGALLGFVNSASRLNAIETCEGNVQLSYFDTQGRMRQTNYDATADSKNTAFEQWIPDAQRACLNFNNSNSVVKLNQPLYLPADWSIEAWFVYPLPETGEWNTLTIGRNGGHHVLVRNRKQLGIYLNDDSLGQNFYEIGFNMESLSPGWHHLTAVGRGGTTQFYIDGKKIGDTKAKALADAEENLKKNPNDAAAKKKVEDINKATLKVTRDVYAIGNFQGGTQQFGKVGEVRIWGVALSDEEIAVNSKTLLSGNEPGLLAYYPMNEATGETVSNQTGNGNNGTMSGASWWGCSASIGNLGNTVLQFDGVNDHVKTQVTNLSGNEITIEYWFKGDSLQSAVRQQDNSSYIVAGWLGKHILSVDGGTTNGIKVGDAATNGSWHHIAMTWKRNTPNGFVSYLDGVIVEQRKSLDVAIPSINSNVYIGSFQGTSEFTKGQIADVRIWKKARTQVEIQADMHKRLSGKEPNLVAYYPLNAITPESSTRKVKDLAGNNDGTVTEAITVDSNTLPIGGDALVSNEYSSITLENTRKVAIMRRFFASTATNGATLLPDKRIEALELKWIGNAQFAPTLLGYIEGPPPVPSENLTVEDDYNGATSVELTMSEDVEFSWNRSQDTGLGANTEIFAGAETEASAGLFVTAKIATMRLGFKGNLDFSYQFQNESSITSSSSLSMTDKLELRGTPEETAKFPHLGKRFIPKNIGYALVVSAIADVFVTRLARSGKMVGYQVQPVDGIPPDVNTITFLMNPAYTMNGSLDGLTGSSATSDRFFKHVPEMRSQYGSLYPASYYRLQEAYNLKQQIEAEDKRRESYFSNFNVRLVDEVSLNRNIDSGAAPTTIGVQREEDKPSTQMTEEEKQKAEKEKQNNIQANAATNVNEQSKATQAKQAEIQSKIGDQEKRVQATDSFAGWQKRMEDIQIRAGKRNIVNTYVWDADGGLRTEQQSFANTVEHTIGGSFAMNAALGVEAKFGAMATTELTAQATVNLTQTMSKTEARSKGFELNVDLGGLEYKGITNYNDNPILPGEKVDRYRFMSFYLEGSTNHFQDFFNYVVDPEWLRSNDEEARALRQAQAGKPNKAWRVLHRVTYVERPALMGFGRDVRKLRAAADISENQQLLAKIAKLEENNRKLEDKLDKILFWVKSQK